MSLSENQSIEHDYIENQSIEHEYIENQSVVHDCGRHVYDKMCVRDLVNDRRSQHMSKKNITIDSDGQSI